MGSTNTVTTNSFKQQLLQGAHCFQAVQSFSVGTHTSTLLDAMASTANLIAGMAVSGAGIATNTAIAYVINSTAVQIAPAATATATVTLTFTGDQFMLALVANTAGKPAGTYDRAITNYAQLTGNTDETAASGTYATGGFALTNNGTSIPDTNTAVTNFTTNPSWTGATLATGGCIIYNKGQGTTIIPRIGSVGNNVVSIHDFGGLQQVTSGTLTINLPTQTGTTAILRIA